MPIYEYHCSKCKKNFETLVMGKEDPRCPLCKTKKVQRLMSACGFVSKAKGGQTVKSTAADSMCKGCTSTSCSTCGV